MSKDKNLKGILDKMEKGFQNSLASASSYNDRKYAKNQAHAAIFDLVPSEKEISNSIGNWLMRNTKLKVEKICDIENKLSKAIHPFIIKKLTGKTLK